MATAHSLLSVTAFGGLPAKATPTLLSATAFGGLPAAEATPTLLAASASGALLVMATGGLRGARLMLAPAGTRLPPGVHAVLAVPATAAPGAAASGRRRAMRVAAGAAGFEPHYTADVTDEELFNKFVKAKAYQALGLLALLSPSGHLLAEAVKIEEELYNVVKQAGEPEAEDKVRRPVLSLIGAAYAIVDLSKGCFPNTGAPPPFLIKVRPSLSPLEGSPSITLMDGSVQPLDFGPSMDDYGKMVSSINISMSLASAVTTYIAAYRAMRVAAGAAAGSESGYTADNADEYLKRKNDVIRSWEFTERNYRAEAYHGDVEQFRESASMAIALLRDLLDKGKDYSAADMTALSFSGQCFRRLALQAEQGYVQDATVVEAVQAMQLVCHRLGISAPAPADPSVDVPYDPKVYFMELSDAVKEFIDGVNRAVNEAPEA